eukprot:EG_transcript_858
MIPEYGEEERWTEVMEYFLERGCYRQVNDMFLIMMGRRVWPRAVHYRLRVAALARGDRPQEALRVWLLLRRQPRADPEEGRELDSPAEIIRAYCRAGDTEAAEGLLRRWAAEGGRLAVPAVDDLLRALGKVGGCTKARQWVEALLAAGIAVPDRTWALLLACLSPQVALEERDAVWQLLRRCAVQCSPGVVRAMAEETSAAAAWGVVQLLLADEAEAERLAMDPNAPPEADHLARTVHVARLPPAVSADTVATAFAARCGPVLRVRRVPGRLHLTAAFPDPSFARKALRLAGRRFDTVHGSFTLAPRLPDSGADDPNCPPGHVAVEFPFFPPAINAVDFLTAHCGPVSAVRWHVTRGAAANLEFASRGAAETALRLEGRAVPGLGRRFTVTPGQTSLLDQPLYAPSSSAAATPVALPGEGEEPLLPEETFPFMLGELCAADLTTLAAQCARRVVQGPRSDPVTLAAPLNSLLVLHCQDGCPDAAQELVHVMDRHGVPVFAEAHSAMVSSFALAGQTAESQALVQKSPANDLGEQCIADLLRALCKKGEWGAARLVLQHAGQQATLSADLYAIPIVALCHARRLPEALAMLDALDLLHSEAPLSLPCVTAVCSCLAADPTQEADAAAAFLRPLLPPGAAMAQFLAAAVAALAERRQWADVTRWAAVAQRCGEPLDGGLWLSALQAACETDDVRGVEQALQALQARGPFGLPVYDLLLVFFARRGDRQQVQSLLQRDILLARLTPTLQTYAAVCAAHARVGDLPQAQQHWREAEGRWPDRTPGDVRTAVATLLTADVPAASLEPWLAWLATVLGDEDSGVGLSPQHYARLVDVLRPRGAPAVERLHGTARRCGLHMADVWVAVPDVDRLSHLRLAGSTSEPEDVALRAVVRGLLSQPEGRAPLHQLRVWLRWGDRFLSLGDLEDFVVRHPDVFGWSVAPVPEGSEAAALRAVLDTLVAVRRDTGVLALRVADLLRAVGWEAQYAHLAFGALAERHADVLERKASHVGLRHWPVDRAGRRTMAALQDLCGPNLQTPLRSSADLFLPFTQAAHILALLPEDVSFRPATATTIGSWREVFVAFLVQGSDVESTAASLLTLLAACGRWPCVQELLTACRRRGVPPTALRPAYCQVQERSLWRAAAQ